MKKIHSVSVHLSEDTASVGVNVQVRKVEGVSLFLGETNKLFRKAGNGEIFLSGSGDYLRDLRKKYARYKAPCEALYEDQVRAIFRENSL